MIESLVHAVLINAGLAVVLAVPAVVASRHPRRPALAHALWLLVLAKLLTPPLVAVPVTWPSPREESPTPEAEVDLPTAVSMGGVLAVPAVPAALPFEEPVGTVTLPELPWEVWVFALWLLGAVAVWSLAALRLRTLHRLLGQVPRAPEALQERVQALSVKLGLARPPVVWLVPGVVPPLLLALGSRARLLLPAGLWSSLDEAQRETLLLHELAHLRRGDHHVRRLELVVLGLYWWHPLAWWAARSLRDAEELCCDAWVVWARPDGAVAYAGALVETVAFLSTRPTRLPLGASGAAPVGSLTRRLNMILNQPPARRLPTLLVLGLIAFGLAVLPLVPCKATTPADPVSAAEQAEDPHHPAHWKQEKAGGMPKSCLVCHQPSRATPPTTVVEGFQLPRQITDLIEQVAAQRKKLSDTEKQLREALEAFEKRGVPKRPRGETDRKKIEELERRLEDLTRELRELRKKALPSERQPASSIPHDSVLDMNQRTLSLPVRFDNSRQAKQLSGYVSSNEGKNWELAYEVDAGGARTWQYKAPRDGLYWFYLVDRESMPPSHLKGVRPHVLVRIDTVAPAIELSAVHKDRGVQIRWKIQEDNPDWKSFQIATRNSADPEWVTYDLEGKHEGTSLVHRATGITEVRLRVKDLAGNLAEKIVSLSSVNR